MSITWVLDTQTQQGARIRQSWHASIDSGAATLYKEVLAYFDPSGENKIQAYIGAPQQPKLTGNIIAYSEATYVLPIAPAALTWVLQASSQVGQQYVETWQATTSGDNLYLSLTTFADAPSTPSYDLQGIQMIMTAGDVKLCTASLSSDTAS